MKITEAARLALEPVLAKNRGKMIRIAVQGFG